MKTKRLLLTTLFIVLTKLCNAQNAYYEAIYYSQNYTPLSEIIKINLNDYSSYNLKTEDAQTLQQLKGYFDKPFENTPPPIEKIKAIVENYNQNTSRQHSSSFSLLSGIASPLKTYLGTLPQPQADTLVNQLYFFIMDKFKDAHKANMVNIFNKTLGKYQDIKTIFPRTFEKVEQTDWTRFNDLGNEFKVVAIQDFKTAVDSTFSLIENPIVPANQKNAFFNAEIREKLLRSEYYNSSKLYYALIKELANGINPFDVMKAYSEMNIPSWVINRAKTIEKSPYTKAEQEIQINIKNNLDTLQTKKKQEVDSLLIAQLNLIKRNSDYKDKINNLKTQLWSKNSLVAIVSDSNLVKKTLAIQDSQFKADSLTVTLAYLNNTSEFSTKCLKIDSTYRADSIGLVTKYTLLKNLFQNLHDTTSIKSDTISYREFQNLFKLIYFVQQNLRDTTEDQTNDYNKHWITFDKFALLDTDQEQGFFLANLKHQNSALFAKLVGNVAAKVDFSIISKKGIPEFNKLYKEYISPFILCVLRANSYMKQKGEKLTDSEILVNNAHLFTDLLKVFPNQLPKGFKKVELIEHSTNIFTMFKTNNYGDFLREVGHIITTLSPEPNNLTFVESFKTFDKLSGFNSAVVNAKSAKEMNVALQGLGSASFLVKHQSSVTLSLTSQPGMQYFRILKSKNLNDNPIDLEKKQNLMVFSIPVGLSASLKLKSCGVIHINYNELDLGGFLNYNFKNIGNDSLFRNMSYTQLFNRELAVGYSPKNSPIVIQTGCRWANPQRTYSYESLGKIPAEQRTYDIGIFLKVSYDIPLFYLFKSH